MNIYSLLLGVGASLGLLHIVQRVPEKQALRWLAAGFGLLAAGLAGARAGYVWLNPAYYQAHPQAAWQLTQGGLSWPGALLGGLAAFFLAAMLLRAPLGVAADIFAPMFVTVTITAWLGAAFSGTAYGVEVNDGLMWALPSNLPDGIVTYRWPLQLTAAITLFYISWRLDRKSENWKQAGTRGCATGLLLAGHTALFSHWRADGGLVFSGLRVDLLAAALLGGLCLLGLLALLGLHVRSSLSDSAPGANRETWFSPRQ